MAQHPHPDFHLDVLLYQEDGDWYAHCLQLDLVEAGTTQEGAQRDLSDVIRAHIEAAIEHDNLEHLFHHAPIECWKRFWSGHPIGVRSIQIRVPDSLTGPAVVKLHEASAPARVAA